MSKPKPTLMTISFLLSIMFLGLIIILSGYFINDYINLTNDNTLSGIDYLMFYFFYFIGFLPVSILGLISSVLGAVYSTSKKLRIFLCIEIIIFSLGIFFSVLLYCL